MSGYAATLAAIDRLDRFGIRLGLDRVREYCARSGHPERASPAVHVAGTNGKGSTAGWLASIAAAHGVATGLHTSPHLIDLRERFRVDGRPIPEAVVIALWRRIEPFAREERMTYFEATTLLAFEHFAAAGVDLAIHEVGLGGRLDATNVLVPRIAVVTNVARDHERHLGDDPAAIAREKAGVFEPGVPALVGDPGPPEVRAVFEEVAAAVGSDLELLPEVVEVNVRSVGPEGTRFDYASPAGRWRDLEIPVPGAHFASDAALAIRAWERLAEGADPPVPATDAGALGRGLSDVSLPGRMERREVGGATVLLDVAHNPDAVGRLAATLRSLGGGPSAFVVGILADKAWEAMLDALEPAAARAWLCGLASASPERRLTGAAAARPIAARPWVSWAESVKDGLAAARGAVEAGEAERIVVTGSFRTVGEALLELGLAEAGVPYDGLRSAGVG